jgi:AAA family ATP:ADP antiporter
VSVPPRTGARTAWVGTALALLTAAFVVAKTGRDALYFQGRGLYDLPRAYIGIALLALPMAFVVLALMRTLGTRRARVATPLAAALVFAAFYSVARPGGGGAMTALFLSVPLVFGVLFSLSWLLGADLLAGAARPALARAYTAIAAASMAGGVAGGGLARVLAHHIEPRALLLVAAAGLVAAAAVMAMAHARHPILRAAAATGGGRFAPFAAGRALVGEPYTALLLAIGMLASLAGILIEFQFYLAAATSGHDAATNARFFAGFYAVLNAAALGAQLLAAPFLQRRIGVHGTLLVLPGVLLGGASLLLGTASMLVRSSLRIAEGGLKSSIHRASWEQAYLPLHASHRATAKLLVDGAGPRIAEGVAAVAVYAWLRWSVGDGSLVGRSTNWVVWTLLACSLVWVVLTRRLGRRLAGDTGQAGAGSRLDVPLPDT